MQSKARRSTRSTKAVPAVAVRSKIQSERVTAKATEQDTILPSARDPTGSAAQEPTIIRETVEVFDQLDGSFYASFYQDLHGLSEGELCEHWAQHGRSEGRFPNISTWLTAEGAPELPSDFSVNFYRSLNPDLAEQRTDFDLIRHYVKLGRSEGRRYSATWDDVAADLLGMRSSQIQEIRAKKLLGGESLTKFLDKHGIYSTEFFRILDVGDYQARVGISRCADKLECIVHFVAEGQYQAIPIGSDYDLDEQIYLEFVPEVAGLSRAEIYRHWLNIGLRRGLPINALHLMKGIGLPNSRLMPSGFDWRAYLWSNPDLSDTITTPWQALRHFITHGIAELRPGCNPTPSTAPFYIHVADQLAVRNDLASARPIYETALLADPLNTRGLRHYGDCLMRLGDFYGASIVYQRTIREARFSAWTFLNLANCLKKLNLRAEGTTTLKQLSQIMPDDQYIKAKFFEASEEYCYSLSSIANRLAASGLYDAGRREMGAAVEVLANTVKIEKPLVPHKGSIQRIGIVADMSIPQCKYYRVFQKQEHLQLAGYQVFIFDQATELTRFHKELPSLDAVIFYRVAALPPAVRAIRATRTAGLPTIYDIDDLIFDDDQFPDTFESYGGMISAEVYAGLVTGTALFKKAIALCDFSIASTKPLSELMQRLAAQKTAFVHPNALGRLEELFLARARSARTTLDEGRPVNVFYGTGTRAHNKDFELLAAPALLRLLKKYGPRIRLVIIGYLSLPQELEEFQCFILKISEVFDRERYFHLLSEMDINIAVLSVGLAADCKSEIKWMEAAMLGIPSVVSNTATYEDVVVDGKTGLIAADSEDWFRHLDALIEDSSLRRRIGDAAKNAVSKKYSPEVSARNIKTIFDRIESTLALRETKARLRVLIVHVFYPPQAIGGATRVVADNVRDLLKGYREEIEVEVFCTIEGGASPYVLHVYQWDGARVNGVTTPVDPEIDLRTADKQMSQIFGEQLERFRPDLIHFHCVQRLTPSVCLEALARNIPYLVTIHDGWWISHNQFLLDSNNRHSVYKFEDPVGQLIEYGAGRFGRMKELKCVLDSAKQVLAVSSPFAQVYRDLGFTNIRVVENGVSDLPVLKRRSFDTAKVRIAHIGGRSFHKGFNHLRAALSDLKCHNIEVLLIDHALPPGEENLTVWGASIVRVRGKVPQTEVGELYATVDVLAAPSVWPESYGLVVREALQAGCWIIASDRGALSEAVDKNCGFVVPIDNYEALKGVLTEIDGRPHRYKESPMTVPQFRSSRQQADELMEVYREFAGAGKTPPQGKSKAA